MDDVFSSSPLDLFYLSGKATPINTGLDDWIVEGIEGHRVNPSSGDLEFLVRWQGWDPTDLQWEPLRNFFQLCNDELLEYCDRHDITLNLVELFKVKGKKKVRKHD